MSPDPEPALPAFRSPERSREFLVSTDLFGSLDDGAMEEILDRAEWVHLSGGAVLFRQGDAGDAMYVVVSGRVQVVVESPAGVQTVVREMGRGENFGELSLLTDDPRAATIRAVRDTELLSLQREAFTELLEARPRTAVGLTRILARWLREGNQGRPERRDVSTVAVVPGTTGTDSAAFTEELASRMRKHGSLLVLDARTVDARLQPGTALAAEGTPEHRAATDWLGLQELEHRFLVYVADGGTTAWSRRCLRQSDVILVVARAGSDEPLLPLARETVSGGGPGARAELVLLHAPGTEAPGDTARWLDAGAFETHHHVRADDRDDLDRLARHLSGRAVGLVLGGGGARGFAHVGVVRALREAGIPLDRLGGASMGSIVAGMFATGMDAREVQHTLQWAWDRSGNKPHRDLTFPAYSLVTGAQVRRMLGWVFEDRLIEDLWTPFFCTTTNLTRGETRVHRRGSVVRWIEASVAIPGIVPPVVTDDGELLADGALLNSLPTGVMQAEARGPVAAVNVSSDLELRVTSGDTRAPSGWAAVTGRLLPFRTPPAFPGIFRILHRSAVLGSVQSERHVEDEVDLYLEPPMEAFDMFDWTALPRIVEAGYRYASERLAEEPDLVETLAAP